MCLGIPGRVVDIETGPDQGLDAGPDPGTVAMARVDFGGVQRDVCLAYVPDAAIGDYVLVHVGFAVRRMEAAEAQGILDLLRDAGAAVMQAPA